LSTFSRLSTNGDTTDSGGNGIDALVFAQAGLPAPGNGPTPSATPAPNTLILLLMAIGAGFVWWQYRSRTA